MIILITTVIFTISILGLLFLLFQKISALVEMPEMALKPGQGFFSRVKGKAKNIPVEKHFHKAVSKIRIIASKTDSKTFNWLQKLRQKSEEKTDPFKDDYWKKIKGKD